MEREVSEVDRKLLLKRTYLDKIHYHLTRNSIEQDELYLLVRKFFKELLKLDYEFTYEELSQELNKVFIKPNIKEHIDDFLIRLSESEYLEEDGIGQDGIIGFLREFDEIIQDVIYDEESPQETETLIHKVLNIKHKSQAGDPDLPSISLSIDEVNFYLTNGNLEAAKKSYVNMMKAYDSLGRDNKKKVHEEVNEAYERLQSAIKNPAKMQAVQASNDKLKRIASLIDETTYYVNANNIENSKAAYAETLKVYESLDHDDKASMHQKVNGLYIKVQALSKGIKAKPAAMEEPASKPQIAIQKTDNSKPEPKATGYDSPKGMERRTSAGKPGANILFQDNASDDDIDSIPTGIDEKRKIEAPLQDETACQEPAAFEAPVFGPMSPAQSADDVRDSPNVLFSVEQSSESAPSGKAAINHPIIEKAAPKQPVQAPKKTISKAKASRTPEIQPIATSSKDINISLSIQNIEASRSRPAAEATDKIHDIAQDMPKHPGIAAAVPPTPSAISHGPQMIAQLEKALKIIEDDLTMEQFVKAKESYRNALLVYRSMNDHDKGVCYNKFYATFKKLDEALHQVALHELLDKHMLESKKSNRPLSRPSITATDDAANANGQTSPIAIGYDQKQDIPVIVTSDPDTVRVYELIEESYFNIDNSHHDLAMLKYFKALDLYHKLPVDDKKKAYPDMYRLFKNLSPHNRT